MTESAVNGRNGCGARAGARTLTLLAAPPNHSILLALGEGPRQQVDLRRESGHPAQTTLRAQLKKLHAAGVIEKQRRNRFPGVLEYELSEAGHGLLPVIEMLKRWLASAPEGGLELGEPAAKAAVKALTDGWSTAMLRALAARSLTLTELDGVIASLNYPSLERRLSAMRLAGLVEGRKGDGRGTPYRVTTWGREGVAPLVLAARWERRHPPPEATPVAKLDIEAAFLLAAQLLSPPADLSGSCRLAVEVQSGNGPALAGILASVSGGRIASCTTRLEGNPDAWASGGLAAWFAAVLECDLAGLQLGGDGALARGLIHDLHGALFAVPVPAEAPRL